jgi:hypothetical protein
MQHISAPDHNVPVIPLLLDGATMPRADELQPSLVWVVRRQAPSNPAQPGFDYDTQPAFKVLDPTLTKIPPSRAHLSRGRAEWLEKPKGGSAV